MAGEARVQSILRGIAAAADGFAAETTGTEHVAASAVAGIVTGIAGLLKDRSVEEVKDLIMDLAAHPAAKVHLEGIAAKVEAALRNREEEDES